jgi:hypothetical protein
MKKQELKDAEELLTIKATAYLSTFTKELDTHNFNSNYQLDVEFTDNKFIVGSRLDALIMGACLAEGTIDNKLTLDNKIKALEIMALITSKVIFNSTPEIADLLSEIGRKNAFKSHKETYELKKSAIDYWRENIDPKKSNDKAADILAKVFPVSPRKLSQYVSEAKKQNTSPASKV